MPPQVEVSMKEVEAEAWQMNMMSGKLWIQLLVLVKYHDKHKILPAQRRCSRKSVAP